VGKGCSRVKIVQNHVHIYANGKLDPLKLFQEWGREDKENDEGVISAMTYCKNFCKCHNVSPAKQLKI
jgi:hypothetical protein